MARMFPDTLDGKKPTRGEALVFDVLRRRLTPHDEHWVWYEPAIPVKRGKAPEPDFVVLGPEYGLVVLEVKDWGRRAFHAANPSTVVIRELDGREVSHTHPLKQAQGAAYALKDRIERTPGLTHALGKNQGKSILPINRGVVFPNVTRRELESLDRQAVIFPSSRCIVRDDLELDGDAGRRRLIQRLTEICEIRFYFGLDVAIRRRVRAAIEPQIHFRDLREADDASVPAGEESSGAARDRPAGEGPSGGDTVPPPEKRVTRMPLPRLWGHFLDRKQARMARELASPRNVVYGPAGSGKTEFLIARAHYWLDHRLEARILHTCYNASLASHLRKVFAIKGLPPDGKRLTVRHYYDLCGFILGRDDIHERPTAFYSDLEAQVLAELERRKEPLGFDCILIDEGQDFSRPMLDLLSRLTGPGGEITLVCDPAQDIYGRWSPDNPAALGRCETERLMDCYRNTAPIFALALSILPDKLREAAGLERLELTRPEDLGRDGPPPDFRRVSDLDDLLAVIVETVEDAGRRGIPLSDVAILYPDHNAIPNFPGRLRHSTWQAAADPVFAALDEGAGVAADAPGTVLPFDDPSGRTPVRPHFAEALLAEITRKGIPAEWITRDFTSKSTYDISRLSLTLSTIHSAKGLDFDTVALLGIDSLPVEPRAARDRAASLLFTGVTRARERLVVPWFLERGWVGLLAVREGDKD